MSDSTDTRFEDDLTPFARGCRRVARALRWGAKGILSQPRTVLIETRWRLGDEVMALPIYEAVKAQWPGTRVAVLCNYPELVAGNPHVDEVNTEEPDPDRCVFLRDDARDVSRIAHYASISGLQVPDTPPTLFDVAELSATLPDARPRIAIAAGATWETKRWPESHWQELIQQFRNAGGATIELGAGHAPVGGDTVLIDKTNVSEAAAVIRACDVLITGDSGLMHLGLAAGASVVALFGPTDPAMLVGDHPSFTVISNSRECAGCWNRSQKMVEPGVCPRAIAQCLEPISPEAVFAAAMQIIDNAHTP